MATLQLRNIDDRLYNFLKNSAKRQNRSVSQEVVTIIQQHLHSSQPANATLEFLALSGAWKDESGTRRKSLLTYEAAEDLCRQGGQIAGLSRLRFETVLAEHEIPVSKLTADEVMNDMSKLRQELRSHR